MSAANEKPGITTPVDPRSTLRSAFHMQALLLVVLLAALILFHKFGYSNETVLALGTLCSVAAYVLCLWSFYFSFRAARAGLSWRKTAVIWGIAAVELLAPAAYYACASFKVRDEPLFVVTSLCVGGPLLVVLGVYVLTVGVFTRGWKRRTAVNVFASSAVLALLLTVLPAALLIFAVLNNNPVSSRTTARTVINAIPEFLQDGVEKSLRGRGDRLENWRDILCWRGMLSRQCLLAILQDKSDAQLASSTWYGLKEFREQDRAQLAIDLGFGRIAPLAADVSGNEFGVLIAKHASQAELIAILNRSSALSKDLVDGILNTLADRPDCPLEFFTMHRLCIGRDVLLATKISLYNLETMSRHGLDNRDLKVLREEQDIYFDWQLLKDRELTDSQSWSRLVQTCRQNTSRRLRRLSATALADLLMREIRHIPFADELSTDGTPAPITLDESEELEQLCNAAEAQVARLAVDTHR